MKIDNMDNLKTEIINKITNEITNISLINEDLTEIGLNDVKYQIKTILISYIKKERILTLKIE
jgi:hypothetical protein